MDRRLNAVRISRYTLYVCVCVCVCVCGLQFVTLSLSEHCVRVVVPRRKVDSADGGKHHAVSVFVHFARAVSAKNRN